MATKRKNPYRKQEWLNFREELFELSGHTCKHCSRCSKVDDIILQVHHKEYYEGRAIWEYGLNECEVLCQGCHGRLHGKIKPSFGWTFIGQTDSGELCSSCELCQNTIRHEFYIYHPKWGEMTVGTYCCDRLTGTTEASDHQKEKQLEAKRKKNFLSSKRWTESEGGKFTFHRNNIQFEVVPVDSSFALSINGGKGPRRYSNVVEAKERIYEILSTDEVKTLVDEINKRLRKKNSLLESLPRDNCKVLMNDR